MRYFCASTLKSRDMYKIIVKSGFALISMSIMLTASLYTMAQPKKDESFTIENYYKVKWGYADEFIDLWKKNHYPLLKKAQEKGDIISVKAEKPRYHSGEDTRWDFKVDRKSTRLNSSHRT